MKWLLTILIFTSLGGYSQQTMISQSRVINLIPDLRNKEPLITSPNTIKKYLNGYKQFVSFNADSIPDGSTNFYYTNAKGLGTVLTGYVSGSGTVASTDNILQAIQKLNGNDLLYLALTGGTMGGNIIFTDNTYDIGASGATRPRTGYFGTSVIAPTIIGTSNILTNTTGVNSNAFLVGGTALGVSQSTAAYITGGNNIQFRAGFRGSVATVATASNDVFAVAIGDNTYTEATSGTSALGGGLYVKTQSFTNGSGATTDFQNVYVGDAPTGATNNWSINAGASKFRSKVTFGATTTSAASFNLPTGTAPSSPVDGDVWREDNTNTGLKIRVNGVTKTISLL